MKLNITKQDYSKKPTIDGVKIVEVPYFTDDGGFFLELGRWQKQVLPDFPEFELKQINYSEMDPGVIKAWHLHLQQEDIWFVPPNHKLLVALRDCREQSNTNGVIMRVVAGAGKARLIYIPRGVAHGAANLWPKPASVIYLVNNLFTQDPKLSDEGRLPWDEFGKEVWEITKG
ncbi:MAG: dTDP-4-dehydrorhamnose 3,5-epimerase family protein [Patescibacteria group bacterium]|jgi:dTDP-4-dehydrorhamnose 3,5-epimerase